MKKYLLLLFLLPQFSGATLIPYGAITLYSFPACIGGNLIYAQDFGPAKISRFFDSYGTYRFANFAPALRPGQYQLGQASLPVVCFIPCQNGICPYDIGFLKIYEGTSL